MRNHFGAVFKRRKLKHTNWAVPNNGARCFELGGQFSRCLRTNVQNQIVVRHLCGFFYGRYGVRCKCFGAHHICGNRHFCAASFHSGHDRFGLLQQIRFGQTFADLQTCGQHEGVGDTTTDDQLVYFVCQAFQNSELGAHLAARHDSGQWPLGMRQGFLNRVDLRGQQRACTSYRRKLRNTVSRTFRAVCGAKSVVDKNIAERCQFVRQLGCVFLLPLVDAAVFQHHQLAWSDVNRRDACLVVAVDPVGN